MAGACQLEQSGPVKRTPSSSNLPNLSSNSDSQLSFDIVPWEYWCRDGFLARKHVRLKLRCFHSPAKFGGMQPLIKPLKLPTIDSDITLLSVWSNAGNSDWQVLSSTASYGLSQPFLPPNLSTGFVKDERWKRAGYCSVVRYVLCMHGVCRFKAWHVQSKLLRWKDKDLSRRPLKVPASQFWPRWLHGLIL